MQRCVSILVTLALAAGVSAAPPHYGDWSAPTLVAAVNTPALEFPNGISKDGLSLYFQRGDATLNGEDIWVVHRASDDAPWETPQKLSSNINSAYNDRAAFVSADGHWLVFASDRPGGRGSFDLMVSWRAHVHEDFGEFGWQPAVNLDEVSGTPINTAGFESGPAIFENDESGTREFYFVSNPTGGQALADIYVSYQGADGALSTPVPVAVLNSTVSEGRPYLTHDGLEIYFQSNRPGGKGGFDIWTSTRPSVEEPWSIPHNVDSVNTPGNDVTPVLTWDRLTLFMGINGETFSSTRRKQPPRS